jgi:hypothetical protein
MGLNRSYPQSVLDRAMPAWTSREFHEVEVRGVEPAVLSAVHDLTWAEVPVFDILMNIRGINVRKFSPEALERLRLKPVPEPDRVLSMFDEEFFPLYTSDTELVFGVFLPMSFDLPKFEPGDDPVESFRNAHPANVVKVAFNMWIHDGVLSTETRNLPIGFRSHLVFGGYWTLIGPFSGLIRHVWIRAIRDRAVRTLGH